MEVHYTYCRKPFLLSPHPLAAPDWASNLPQATDSGPQPRAVHSILDDELGDLLRRIVAAEFRRQDVVWSFDDHAVGT